LSILRFPVIHRVYETFRVIPRSVPVPRLLGCRSLALALVALTHRAQTFVGIDASLVAVAPDGREAIAPDHHQLVKRDHLRQHWRGGRHGTSEVALARAPGARAGTPQGLVADDALVVV